MNKLLLFCILLIGSPLYIHGQTEPVDTDSDGKREVSTLDHLLWISTNTGGWGYSYEQTANIDASATSTWNSGAGFSPIGSSGTSFSGTYDGQGFTISNITIVRNLSGNSNIGFFGTINGGTVKNLGLLNVSIWGSSATGGLVGIGSNMLIENCYITGLVKCQYDYVGGMVGTNNSNCTISKSYSTATVQGALAGSGSYAGGLVGYNLSGGISQSYSTGPVSGINYVAGFVGVNSTGDISNCYSRGSVNGSFVSGFVDVNNTSINYSYSTGVVSGTSAAGFVRSNSSSVTASFWDITTSNQASSAAGEGKLTADMITQSTFLNAGWNSDIWNMDTRNDGYPYLDWENPGGSPLPVELVSFTGRATENDIILFWMTVTEVDNYGFEIERMFSESGEFDDYTGIWEFAGFVCGNGNCNSPQSYSFADKNIKTGFYQYRLKQIDTDGSFEYSSAIFVKFNNIPDIYSLDQNYPNPFNPETVIRFALPERSFITLEIYSISGEKLGVIASGEYDAGRHQIKADASAMPSGIYMYALRYGGNKSLIRKMAVLR